MILPYKARLFISDQWELCVRFVRINPLLLTSVAGSISSIEPDTQASLIATQAFVFQISTCERAYSLRAVWPTEEVELM
jgi:hypothetical protein